MARNEEVEVGIQQSTIDFVVYLPVVVGRLGFAFSVLLVSIDFVRLHSLSVDGKSKVFVVAGNTEAIGIVYSDNTVPARRH